MEIKEYHKDKEGLIYQVTSERDKNITYIVAVDNYDGWYCTCEDYKFRKHKCKHIRAVTEYLQKNYYNEYVKYKSIDIFLNLKK